MGWTWGPFPTLTLTKSNFFGFESRKFTKKGPWGACLIPLHLSRCCSEPYKVHMRCNLSKLVIYLLQVLLRQMFTLKLAPSASGFRLCDSFSNEWKLSSDFVLSRTLLRYHEIYSVSPDSKCDTWYRYVGIKLRIWKMPYKIRHRIIKSQTADGYISV